ncbi:hypothetical protein HO133_009916 [Letharia lupina]|uniref:DUF6604 domain-containing protein n=1 Tax=Letharia lupina TaxID=560253 RepID=A0A8H6CJP5_9LECA|nr:uncharacterized protein HO133_009916 [Letharia lupina]KAF6224723.1 hypothetical protein HO133_009916 [Letharia lupina]
MLLGTSHPPPPSGGRIPPSLFDLYVQYKQDTRAIIAWLMSHGTNKIKSLHNISIRDLLGLAEVVQKKAVVMPDSIDFQFRQVIAARTQLSNFFRTKSGPEVTVEDTVNHEFFTESLTKIYTDLYGCCAKPVEDRKRTGRQKSQVVWENRFAALNPGTTDTCCDCGSDLPSDHRDGEGARQGVATVPRTDDTPQLLDDPLGDAFEICKELQVYLPPLWSSFSLIDVFQEMDDLLLATKGVWEQAGKGDTPLVMAALMTNVAFARFESVEQRLDLLCDGSDPGALRAKLMGMQDAPMGSTAVKVIAEQPGTQAIENLQQSWHLLLHLKDSIRATKHGSEMVCTPKPSNILLRIGPNSGEADEKCLSMILYNIKQHVQAKCLPTDIVRAGSPLYADIGYFLTHEENNVNGLRCAFGLRMLLDAYKSFMLACQGVCAPPSCRLQALKLAQEALHSVHTVLEDSSMPCRCPQTLAFHLGNLELDLKTFLQEKCFDLYFQSPWVSGSHILEMHETLFYYGLRLFSYRHYVGSVVHVYHALRELTGFRSIPLLEQLRNTFNDVLFPGGRPSRNFKACCIRYMGGRLKFRSDGSDHRSGSHHMAVPAHTAKATAGFGLRKEANDTRFAYCKISLFYHIKEKGYHVNESLWNRIHAPARPGTCEKDHEMHTCAHNHPTQEYTSMSCPHQFSHLKEATLPDFAGPFPIARVNFFQIYMSCVQIISIVSDKTHDGGERGRNCVCFLDAILQAADRYKANEHKLQPFGFKELVSTCQEAMSAVLGERSVDDFLWKTF